MYNGYTNYITWRIMHDYANKIIENSTEPVYYDAFSFEQIVRTILHSEKSNATSNSNMHNIFDYAMYSLNDVNWKEIVSLMNEEINSKFK